MNQMEKDLFLRFCRFRKSNAKRTERLLNNGAETTEVPGSRLEARIATVAYHMLPEQKLSKCVNRKFRNTLRNTKRLNAKQSEDSDDCICLFSSELNSCGTPHAMPKVAYLFSLYPQGYRIFHDIDILLLPKDIGRVAAKLKTAKFQQSYLKNGADFACGTAILIERR